MWNINNNSNSNKKKLATDYLRIPQESVDDTNKEDEYDDDSSSCVIGRYRVIANDPLPAMCDLMSHTSLNNNSSSTMVEACVIGGVLWKLQQFCRTQQRSQNSGRFWRTQLLIWGVYVMLIVSVGMLLDGTDSTSNSSNPASTADNNPTTTADSSNNNNSIRVAGGIVLVTVMYLVVLALVGDKLLGTSQVLFRSKLDALLQEMSNELQTIGYSVQIVPKKRTWSYNNMCPFTSHISIVVKKQQQQHQQLVKPQLPPVSQDFLNWTREQPLKETRISVDSILYHGGNNPWTFVSSNANSNKATSQVPTAPRYTLPVDDWLAGGLMMRLRIERHRASQRSRLLACCLSAPVIILMMMGVCFMAFATSDSHPSSSSSQSFRGNDMTTTTITTTSVYHGTTLFVLAVTSGMLTLMCSYLREFLDGSTLHSVSRTVVVQQFAGLAKDRHDVNLTYDVASGDFLPKTTKGMIRFKPMALMEGSSLASSSASNNNNSNSNKKSKGVAAAAQLAFV